MMKKPFMKSLKEISLYEAIKADYGKKAQGLKSLQDQCKDLHWLDKALGYYEKITLEPLQKPKPFFLILAALCIVPVVIFAFLEIPVAVVLSILAAAVFAALYIIKINAFFKKNRQSFELEGLKKEFKKRIGKDLTSPVDISSILEKQKDAQNKAALLEEQIRESTMQMENAAASIRHKIEQIKGSAVEQSSWQDVIREKKEENIRIKSQKDSIQSRLFELGVREIEYTSQDPNVQFSFEEYEKIEQSIDALKEEIRQKESDIDNLKYSICAETGDDPSTEWEDLLENLIAKRRQKQKEHDQIKAKIIAGIIVHAQVEELRKQEDEKIREGLCSETVLKPLRELTCKYKKIQLDDNGLILSDDYRDYLLHDLSTGANEQVMLALRIGFSARICKSDTLFLILDDAFQHSDWDRRKVLVSQLADIAKSGWQIIYLSMDDHIRDLFEEEGKKFQSGQYNLIEL
jgi:uncharacterized protein YhaN